jgi:predicted RecB family nuclease
MWADVPGFLDETFPGWEAVEAEEKLYEEIDTKSIKFKGFIDAVIKVPRKNGTYKYWILDWKTAKSYGWDRRKKQDFLVQAQVVLYKHYWAKKHNIPLKDIGCGFILLKRGGKPGKMCEFLPISAGPKMLEKSVKMVRSMVSGVYKKLSIKNRNSCRFCEYYQTEHCT